MRNYSALFMAGVTSCSNMVYTSPDEMLMDIRQRQQADIYTSLFHDTDLDGVSDYWDQCLNTPRNLKVSVQGCPMDTNGNGIPDYKEALFGSQSNSIVEEEPIFDDISLALPEDEETCFVDDEYDFASRCYGFDYDSAVVSAEMRKDLDALVEVLKSDTNLNALEIVGHTDDRGNSKYNLDLSTRRAQSIAAYIAPQLPTGIELLVNGMGEFDPMASNATEEGRAINRRVEIYTLKNAN